MPWRQSSTGRFALSNSFLTPWCPEFRRKVHCRQWTYLVKTVSNLGFLFFLPGWVHIFHRRFYPLIQIDVLLKVMVKCRHDINPLTTSHTELEQQYLKSLWIQQRLGNILSCLFSWVLAVLSLDQPTWCQEQDFSAYSIFNTCVRYFKRQNYTK